MCGGNDENVCGNYAGKREPLLGRPLSGGGENWRRFARIPTIVAWEGPPPGVGAAGPGPVRVEGDGRGRGASDERK